jgi:hypothetical protein
MRRLPGAIAALLATFAAVSAGAHPGHDAPPVHAHDMDEALVMLIVIVGVAAIGLAIRAVRKPTNKDR